MIVYIINRRYCPGEAWTNRVLAYAKGLTELGCKVFLIYLIPDSNRTPYSIDINGVEVINLWRKDMWLAQKSRPISYIINLFKIKRTIPSGANIFIYNADSIILHFAKKCKAKIYTELTEHPYIYNKIGSFGERCIDVTTSIKLKSLDGVCVISHGLMNYLMRIGISKKRIALVNMFVDDTRFNVITKNHNKSPYIAYCGTVSYNKDGVDVLIDSFKLFHSKHATYKLMIIGRGETTEIIDDLKKKVVSIGLEDSIVFTGQVAPELMPSLLTNASILALARPDNLQAKNGFPTKLGEYLATGNPVVVTRVGEIPNYIKHLENGILAEPNNPEDFAAKLSWVADNYDKAMEIGAKGKELCSSCFSYLSQSSALLDLMKQ